MFCYVIAFSCLVVGNKFDDMVCFSSHFASREVDVDQDVDDIDPVSIYFSKCRYKAYAFVFYFDLHR